MQGTTSSREPLLTSSSTTTGTGSAQTPDDDENEFNPKITTTSPSPGAQKEQFNILPKLPGIIPVTGHNISTGWL